MEPPCSNCLILPICRQRVLVWDNGDHFEISLTNLKDCNKVIEFCKWVFFTNRWNKNKKLEFTNAVKLFSSLIPLFDPNNIRTVSIHLQKEKYPTLESQEFTMANLGYVFHVEYSNEFNSL